MRVLCSTETTFQTADKDVKEEHGTPRPASATPDSASPPPLPTRARLSQDLRVITGLPRTMVATHSEGMPLHLSAASTSGYQYVVAKPSGKFQASVKGQFLGSFDTALEAAVCVATHLSLPKEPPSAARGAKRALLTAEARGGKRQQLQQRQAALPEAAEAAVPTDPHRRPTAAARASTAAGARRRPEPQATKAPSAAPTSSRSLVLAPTSAAVPPAAHARQPLTLAPEKHGRAPGDRNGKEICLGSRVLDGQGRRGEIVKRCGAWLTMRSDAGLEWAVRRRSVEVIDAD